MITLVVTPEELQQAEITVHGRAYGHLFRSRRLGLGAAVRLVDGAGSARFSEVIEITGASARFRLEGTAPANEPMKQVELLTPIPRSARLAWLVEKATEIGVSAIRLLQTERGPRRTGGQRLDRLRRIAVSAVEQSQRAVVPEITGVHKFSEVPGLLESTPERWVLQPGEVSRSQVDARRRAALLVGPEGGWTGDELEVLARTNCVRVSLGPTVLRIETAAIVGSAMLLTPNALR